MVGMAASFQYTTSQRFSSQLEERAARQQETYWRIRVTKTLERMERESRRMLALEAELTQFAEHYYSQVGAYVERLTELETQLLNCATPEISTGTLTEVIAQRDMKQTRQLELKNRYRMLAKEIHPDRSMMVDGSGDRASQMQSLNVAYQHGDLATMLKLEAEMLLMHTDAGLPALEERLRAVERAADTYASGYRELLNSPLNELMLRALQARLAGWDWMEAVVKRVQRAIAASERAIVEANITAIGDWRGTTAA
jgi:hypothetical protein